MSKKVVVGLALVLAMALALPASSQMTAKKVIENMKRAYEEEMKGVEDLTIKTNEGITYRKRACVNGRTFYKTRDESIERGKTRVVIYDGEYVWSVSLFSGKIRRKKAQTEISPSPKEMWKGLEKADVKLIGTENLFGNQAYVLSIPDMGKVTMPQREEKPGTPGGGSGKIWIDARRWVLLKIEGLMGPFGIGGREISIKLEVHMKDYRRVDGYNLLFPYREETYIEPIGLTPEEKKMMAGFGEDRVTIEEVLDVKVNTGLSDDLFDGTKLKPGEPMYPRLPSTRPR